MKKAIFLELLFHFKKVATQKVGKENVAQDVPNLKEFIKVKVRSNNKVTRKPIADEAGVSKKTIERHIKEIESLRVCWAGKQRILGLGLTSENLY